MIEIGSGTGLVGLVAAALGAGPVVLTDLSHLVLPMDNNIKLNTGVLPDLSAVSAAELEWGNAVHISSVMKQLALMSRKQSTNSSALSEGTGPAEGEEASISGRVEHKGRYYPDIIIGSDLVYKVKIQ